MSCGPNGTCEVCCGKKPRCQTCLVVEVDDIREPCAECEAAAIRDFVADEACTRDMEGARA